MDNFEPVARKFLSQMRHLDTRINYLEAQEPLFHMRYVIIDNTDSPYSPERETAILCNATAGPITVNLPQVSTDYGRIFYIQKLDATANAVTVDPFGAETIGGSATLALTIQNQAVEILATGSYWVNLGEVAGGSGGLLGDHDHSGDAGDGGTFNAANLTSGAATDGQVLTADGAGGAAWEDSAGSGIGVRATDTAGVALSIPDSAATAIELDSETYDTDTMHDNVTNNSRLTCNTEGPYIIVGNVEWSGDASGARKLIVYKNAFTTLAEDSRTPPDANPMGHGISTIAYLTVGEFVELYAYQTSGSALTIQHNVAFSPIFAMHLLS